MEKVWCVAKTSFVNRWTGSVNTKQRLLLDTTVAEQFVEMGLVAYEEREVTPLEPKKSSPSLPVVADTQDKPSASLPVATASVTSNLPKQKSGRPKKAGK